MRISARGTPYADSHLCETAHPWHDRGRKIVPRKTNPHRLERSLRDPSSKVLRVVGMMGISVCWFQAAGPDATRFVGLLETIKTIVTLYDRIILTALAFTSRVDRILTIGSWPACVRRRFDGEAARCEMNRPIKSATVFEPG